MTVLDARNDAFREPSIWWSPPSSGARPKPSFSTKPPKSPIFGLCVHLFCGTSDKAQACSEKESHARRERQGGRGTRGGEGLRGGKPPQTPPNKRSRAPQTTGRGGDTSLPPVDSRLRLVTRVGVSRGRDPPPCSFPLHSALVLARFSAPSCLPRDLRCLFLLDLEITRECPIRRHCSFGLWPWALKRWSNSWELLGLKSTQK